MSRTMVTFCGGAPTANETVSVTLWVKGSLLGHDGDFWVFKGRTRILAPLELGTENGAAERKNVGVSMATRRVERVNRMWILFI